MSHPVIYICIIVVMVILSAWFSASEMAFNSSNPMRLKKKQEEGSKAAGVALHICENFTKTLSVILIGNNLVNIAASTCMTTLFLMTTLKESVSSVLATVLMTVIILLLGEITPKLLAKRFPEPIACFSAYPIRILSYILMPIAFVVTALVNLLRKVWGKDQKDEDPTVTEDDLSTIIDTVEEEGVIDEDQSELLQSTLEFDETTVYEVMTPRKDMVSIDIEDNIEKIARIISESRYSRIPVYEENIDHMIGVLNLNQFYRVIATASMTSGFSIRDMLTPVCEIHKAMKLPAALTLMRNRHTHLAIVLDEFGGTLGVVTMEDILEEIVGDIWDESDIVTEDCEDLGDGQYLVDGSMSIDDFFDEIDFSDKDFECEYTTMGGWAIEMLNADPHVGDSFEYKNLSVTVRSMDDMRVTKLLVVVHEPEPAEEE